MSAHHHSRSRNISMALAVATTCLSYLLSSADAFIAPSNIASRQHHFGKFNNKSPSSSSPSCLSAASMASPLPPPSSTLLPTFTLFGLNIKKQTPKSTTTIKSKPRFTLPSIFTPTDSRPIILFDGKCNLCNAGVQLILDNDCASNDSRGNLRVAALQSRVGQLLLGRLSEGDRAKVVDAVGSNNGDNSNNNMNSSSSSGSGEFKTIVVATKQTTHFNSAACIYIGRNLSGPLRYLALLASLIPSFIRDPIYKLLSRHRKRFFGESSECRLWDENYERRFVDDGVLTGVWRDPFADPNADDVVDDGEGGVVDLSVGPNLKVGDSVKVISKGQQSPPIVHTHVVKGNTNNDGGGGVCSVGLVGKVVRVLEQRAYPKNVVVKFDNVDCGGDEDDDVSSFEAHFFPGQLRKE